MRTLVCIQYLSWAILLSYPFLDLNPFVVMLGMAAGIYTGFLYGRCSKMRGMRVTPEIMAACSIQGRLSGLFEAARICWDRRAVHWGHRTDLADECEACSLAIRKQISEEFKVEPGPAPSNN